MQKTIITLSIILIGSIVANTSHAWTQAGKFRDWGVAVNDKNCAAWTVSKKSNTQAEIFVLFAKGQNTADVHFKIPNLLSKYQLKKVKLEVSGAKYDYQLNITEPSIASSTPTNKKSIIVDSWEQLRVEWFNAPSKFRSHVDVIDCKSKNNQGFK